MNTSKIRVFAHGQRLGIGKFIPHYAGQTVRYIEVTFATNGQMTVYAEDIVCGLVFSKDGDSITAKFILSVEKAPLADDTEISDTDLSILSNMRGVTA